MKTALHLLVLRIAVVASLLTAAAWAQGDNAQLERVLTRMDEAARTFKTTQATLVSDQYQKIINESETQKGTIYFRREGGEIQMAIDFDDPDKKYIVYTGGKVQMYQSLGLILTVNE